ncbi:hypothetical protein ACO0LG_27150 [Undibacterium sp. Ji42W]|uniref:hypothetical protein n=1 Tax=Undibacterium sp. Ji42W TaxID=3413039 RepID=UPI003BF302CA
MKKMIWLIHREYWENKTLLVWTHAALALIIALLYSIACGAPSYQFSGKFVEPADMDMLQTQFVLSSLADSFMFSSALLSLLLPLLMTAYCISSLFNDRQDRSILFWQSMPVSGVQTLLSKLVFALLLLPLATFTFSLLTALLVLIPQIVRLQMAGLHANVFAGVFGNPVLLITPLKVLALLPLYVLWALPTVGWLMLVSAWARSKPALWVVGTPLLTVGLLALLNNNLSLGLNMRWLEFNVIGRGLMSSIPGSWFAYAKLLSKEDVSYMRSFSGWPGDMFRPSLDMFAKPELWCGVLLGIVMLVMAAYFRQRRDIG